MKLLFAPMHGITLAHYRNLHAKHFGGVDEYYAPFIVTTEERQAGPILFDDVRPENNDDGLSITPQLLSNNGDDFKVYAKIIANMGYKTMNWNIGCPFPRVTRKVRGAGLLQYPEMIKKFMESAFDESYQINVKMRLGYEDFDEGFEVMKVLNQYPVSGVTIHGRTGIQKYEGRVDLDAFDALYKMCDHPVTYNGDIYTVEDFKKFKDRFPNINDFMIGRGALRNPFIFSQIKGVETTDEEKLIAFKAFHDDYFQVYMNRTDVERAVLGKIKDFWTYTYTMIDPEKVHVSELRKAQDIKTYTYLAEKMFDTIKPTFK